MIELMRRIRYFLQRDRITRELEEEMRLHVEMRAESLRRNLAGATNNPFAEPSAPATATDDAYVAARKRFGNASTLQQQSRDMWGFARVEELRNDVRFAFRRLWKERTVSAMVVGVMGIGIGATTAMFTAIDAALLRPLPFANPEQLAVLPIQVPFAGTADHPARARRDDFSEVRAMRNVFTHVAAYGVGGLNLTDSNRPERLRVGVVTDDFFSTLGVSPATGRTFTTDEGKPGGNNVVVLSNGLWKRNFGSRNVSGLKIILNKTSYEVIGVMPAGFTFPEQSDVWIPMSVPNTMATFEAFRDFVRSTVIVRVADNLSLSDASAQLLTRWEQQRPTGSPADSARYEARLVSMRKGGVVSPLQQRLAGDRRLALFVLLGATAMLLLIACANVTNLLLAQASVRRREIAVRQALGATRLRIVRQLLTESILLSMSGALAGLLVALATSQALQAFMPAALAGVASVQLDYRMLAFATLLAAAAGMLFGLWPALRGGAVNAAETIKSGGGHGATAGSSGRLRRALVGAELALTVVLLIGSGIMLRSFEKIVNRDTGMNTASVGSMELAFSSATKIPERLRAINAFTARLSATPGIKSAGASKTLPLATAGQLLVSIEVDGVDNASIDYGRMPMTFEDATPGYFAALGIPLLEGRLFNDADEGSAHRVAIVNASTARRYWPNGSPIGRTIRMGGDSVPITVVGVVADVPNQLDDEPTMQIYHPLSEDVPFVATIVARGDVAAPALLRQMAAAVRAVDATQPVFNLRMMDDVRNTSVAPRRTSTRFITIFALLALVLASVGVYGVVSYSVSHRTRELGIRSALGATGADLMRMISREMMTVAIAGMIVGLGGAWALARMLEKLVYGVAVHDTITFALVPLVLLAPAVLATLIPARRTLRLNPADVMRAD